jgi:hypothetical protein
MMSGYRLLIVSLLVGLPPAPVIAQSTEQGSGQTTEQGSQGSEDNKFSRPFRGLFGLGDEGRKGLDVSGSLFGAYDDNLTATLPGASIDPRFQRSGEYAGATGQLSFNWQGERAAFNSWAGSSTSYYPDEASHFVTSYTGGAGVTAPLGRRSSIRVSESVIYTPYFLFGFLPSVPPIDELPNQPIEVGTDFTITDQAALRYLTNVNLERSLSREASLSVYYGFGLTNYQDQNAGYRQQRVGALFRRRLTRNAHLRLGYGYRTATYSDIPSLGGGSTRHESHDVDAGVDYSRALSLSRRTKVSFMTGSSILVRDTPTGAAALPGASTRVVLTGSASLVREVGRTWRTGMMAARTTTFSDVLLEPVTSNSVSVFAGGLLSRRQELTFRGSYSAGDVGTSGVQNGFATYLGSAAWRIALTRHLAAFATYLYYHYDFGRGVNLPTGVASKLDRQGVRVGISGWLPLLRR